MQIPLILTLIRLIIAPIFLPILLVNFLPLNNIIINVLLAGLFFLFGVTDFFDGYLARRYRLESISGTILDPLADKFLVSSTLIALTVAQKIYFLWVIIIILREFFVTGLREIALSYHCSLPVSYLGKIKTLLQMLLIFFLILKPYHSSEVLQIISSILLGTTLFFTLLSGLDYYRCFKRNYNKK